jgi:hypothetical protein
MVTMPLAFLLGALLVLGLRWGGWAALPLLVAVAFGLVAASTDPGGVVTGWINDLSAAFFAKVRDAS